MRDRITVIRVKNGAASFEKIDNSVRSFRSEVGGRYTEYMPFGEEHVLLVNSRELDNDGEISAVIRNDRKEITDVIIGDFLVARCRVTEGEYSDMNPDDETDAWLFEQFKVKPVLKYENGRFKDA